jgi:chromosome partitioning protein
MYTVVMASQKGGSGKTTLSGHLAVEADRMGAGPVALIDTDPQGSLAQWWNARAKETPHFVKVGLLDLEEALAHLAKTGFKLAIIDTPPAITDQISHVVAHADLVVVPTRPSPHDLRAVGATVDIAERHGKPLIFVVNGATARARITGEAAVALSQHGTVAPVTLHHRVDFAASMVDGRTVGEVVAKSQSTKEISDLWIYIQDRLSRLMHDPAFVPEHRPAEMALGPLSVADEEVVAVEEVVASEDDKLSELATSDELPPMVITADYQGPDRRSGEDRRDFTRPQHYGPSDKRVHGFGRRATDRPQPFGRSGLGSGLYK